MRLPRWPALLIIRRLVRELSGIREQLTLQTACLQRLADHLVPIIPTADQEQVARESGLDYVDPIDQVLIQAFRERTEATTGHAPTDDEALAYLADEKTLDLHQRLIERDEQLERLAVERRR